MKQVSIKAYRELKDLLKEYRAARNNAVRDESDIDVEAEYAQKICQLIGKDQGLKES